MGDEPQTMAEGAGERPEEIPEVADLEISPEDSEGVTGGEDLSLNYGKIEWNYTQQK